MRKRKTREASQEIAKRADHRKSLIRHSVEKCWAVFYDLIVLRVNFNDSMNHAPTKG